MVSISPCPYLLEDSDSGLRKTQRIVIFSGGIKRSLGSGRQQLEEISWKETGVSVVKVADLLDANITVLSGCSGLLKIDACPPLFIL